MYLMRKCPQISPPLKTKCSPIHTFYTRLHSLRQPLSNGVSHVMSFSPGFALAAILTPQKPLTHISGTRQWIFLLHGSKWSPDQPPSNAGLRPRVDLLKSEVIFVDMRDHWERAGGFLRRHHHQDRPVDLVMVVVRNLGSTVERRHVRDTNTWCK
jgi:hypothetical protein